MTISYDSATIEQKWRARWQTMDLYRTGTDPHKPSHYLLDFFPYPSGAGLSVGHCRNYIPTCIAARYRRMNGHNVLHPMGWDAFGLPAENYAIRHGVHPRVTTARNAATYRRQLQLIECSYDWSREIDSSDPDFYRWTQWFFLLLYRRGLAYRAAADQWWCPVDQTILANEQVEDGRCWRCGSPVQKKTLEQWYFKITAYAERLLHDLETINWPDSIVAMQRNWIGRSEGVDVQFEIQGSPEVISVFTTRPDTLLGVTFLALSPEHPLARSLATAGQQEATAAFVAGAVQRAGDRRHESGDAAAAGVFSGRYALHPLTGEPIPIWIADYVLMAYGSGAVMGVPAHDERDHAFAHRFHLPQRQVIAPPRAAEPNGAYTGHGIMTNSGAYDGHSSQEAAQRITRHLQAAGNGQAVVRYRLRDWLISRQRYWGAPIPIVHCARCGAVPLPEDQLPLLLPDIDDFAPAGDGRSPLARLSSWVQTTCPACGGQAQRETDTMDGFACSSWYFLRFASPHEAQRPFDPQAVRHWLPVDVYVGGAEHAVLHLLYARFWTKVMYDAGLIDFHEPFRQLRNQGVLHAPDGQRMSKSRGNVITPDEVAAQYGVDALRAYIVFMGPFDANVVWDDRGIRGVTRFLERLWKLAHEVARDGEGAGAAYDRPFARAMHQAIRRVSEDMEAYKFNTAVAALMAWLNELAAARDRPIPAAQWREALQTFCLLLAPIAPFIAEELWQEALGHEQSVHLQAWPAYDPALLQTAEQQFAVQVNGRLRDTIMAPADSDDETLRALALASAAVQRHVGHKAVRRTVIVPGRVINLVV